VSAYKSPAQKLLSIWNVLTSFPGGIPLFSFLIKRLVPYSGSIGATVLVIKPGYARVRLRDKRAVRNHLNSIHAVALTNLGELASGLALTAGLPDTVRGIVLEISTEYFKKARGTLIADCQCAIPGIDAKMDYYVQANIHNQEHQIVASVRVKWRLERIIVS